MKQVSFFPHFNYHVRPWDQTNLVLNLIETVKPVFFFTFLKVYVSWIKREKILIWHFHLQNSGILQTRMDRREDPMKKNLSNFQIQKWISQTVWTQKVDEKNGVICLVSFFASWVMVLKLPKIVHFCKFVLSSARNLNPLKQFIYIHLKDLIRLFQKEYVW